MEYQKYNHVLLPKQARVLTFFIQWEIVFHESNFEIPEMRKAAACLLRGPFSSLCCQQTGFHSSIKFGGSLPMKYLASL